MHDNIKGIYDKKSTASRNKFTSEQVCKFVSVYQRDRLFEEVSGREHGSFPKFVHGTSIRMPANLNARLTKHSKTMEKNYYAQEQHGLD